MLFRDNGFARPLVWGGLAAAALVLCLAPAAPADARRERQSERGATILAVIQREQDELHREYAQAMTRIADQCERDGFTADAAVLRGLAARVDPGSLRVQRLPTEVQPDLPIDLPPEEKAWRTEVRKLRGEYARQLYLLSRRALKAGFPSYAYQLVQETARHDPDHAMARRILGFRQQGDLWLTPFAARMQRERYVWHDKYGWLQKQQVAEYEAGKRFYRRWMSAEQEAEIRRDFKHAWEVRTEHYLVKTNHSLERGVEIARLLENYHDVFMQIFAPFFNSPEQMQKLFQSASSGSGAPAASAPYEVHYYRTRDEYVSRLRSRVPNIEITNGLYYTSDRTAYFYFDPEQQNSDTLFHEATHQLFYESLRQERQIALRANFWVIEGIACYMESFRQEGEEWTLGDPRHVRIDSARYRFLNDGYYVPLATFAAMGMQDFQTSPNITKNYSQASGLSHFFMHYEGGRYRDALIEHLSQLYRADPRGLSPVQSLEELTGTSYADLDRQYAEHLKTLEATLANEQAPKPQVIGPADGPSPARFPAESAPPRGAGS